jgi:hypothetical protein
MLSLWRIRHAAPNDAALRELIVAEVTGRGAAASPTAGRMVQALWFDAGPERAGRLWLAIHHLAVDGVSWRILVPDLAAAWQAIAAGQAVSLPPRGTRSGIGRSGLRRMRMSKASAQELPFWRGMQREPSLLISAERLDPLATRWARRASDLDVAVRGDGCAADAGAGGVPWRHRRCAADRMALAVADWCRRHVQGALLSLITAAAMRCCSTSKDTVVRKVLAVKKVWAPAPSI